MVCVVYRIRQDYQITENVDDFFSIKVYALVLANVVSGLGLDNVAKLNI